MEMSGESRLSPDGRHWWDGLDWCPVSEDGSWWWDGQRWNPLVTAVVHEPRSLESPMPSDSAQAGDSLEAGSKSFEAALPPEATRDSSSYEPGEPESAAIPAVDGDPDNAIQVSDKLSKPASPGSTTMPGATGTVRELANGAIVSGNGYFYWSGWKWKPLIPNPPAKPPGNYSRERLGELPKLVRGKSIRAIGDAGADLSRLVLEHGSLMAAEEQLDLTARSLLEAEGSTPPQDAIRSPDGQQWWDGKAWQSVAIPTTAVRSPDGRSWWDGSTWQPMLGGSPRPVEIRSPAPGRVQSNQPPARVARSEVLVKTYKDAKAYERDANKLAAQGWVPQGQTSSRGKANVGRTVGKAVVFLPWALLRPSRKGDPITVTWVRH
jgi:hypothetical protein